MRAFRIPAVVASAALALGLLTVPASAHAVQIDDPGRMWIFGETYRQNKEGCAAPGLVTTMQFNINGRWVDITKSKAKKSRKCGKNYPNVQWFNFTLTHLGTPVPGERKTLLPVRLVWQANGKTWTRSFVKQVYQSKEDHAADLYDCLFDPDSC